MNEELKALVLKVSHAEDVDSDLIFSMVTVESGGDPWRVRFEPGWKYFWFFRQHADRLGISVETELNLQATSFGLMQIMGAVVREMGFEDHLTKLILPETSLTYSCRKIKKLTQKYPELSDAVSSYNQGSPRKTPGGMYVNQSYVDKVFSEYRKRKTLI